MTTLSITLFGGFQVTRDGLPVAYFRGDKVRGLLAYLAIEAGRPHARAALAALFWPDQPDQLALRNLSQALIHLRKALGISLDDPLLDVTRQTIAWRPQTNVAVDVASFAQMAQSADPAQLQAAVDHYSGDLLAGFSLGGCELFEDWLLITREQLQQQALMALERLAGLRLAASLPTEAAALARRQIALDPWREVAYRQLMEALTALDDRAAALATYERCRQLLLADLGAEPDPATIALADRIRSASASPSPARPHVSALPRPLTALFGREKELAAVDGLLRGGARLVTITGVGGVGKTRLALAAARIDHGLFEQICWVQLVGIRTTPDTGAQAESIAGAILAALAQRPSGQRLLVEDLAVALHGRRLLLILDNLEHLSGIAALVDGLLRDCPGLHILGTSRERLNIYGEVVLALEGLAVSAHTDDPTPSAATQLFLDRARRHGQAYGTDEATLASVARLCRVLEGLPLGIELAAHWAGHFSCDEIAAAVQADLAFLETRDRVASDRHRSLHAVFDYTWGQLDERERRILARLTVFLGSFDRRAAQAVADAPVTIIATLVDKSLLRRLGSGRYSMHELLRQFAAGHLAADPAERAAVEQRYVRYYLSFVADRTARLVCDDLRAAAAEIQAELDNIRHAWHSAAVPAASAELAASAYGLLVFMLHAGLIAEGARWFTGATARMQTFLAAGPPAPVEQVALAARLLAIQARLLVPQARHGEALAVAEAALSYADASAATEAIHMGRVVQAMALRRLGRSDEAHALFLQSIAAEDAGPPSLIMSDTSRIAYNWLCSVALSDDDYASAQRYAEHNLAICRAQRMRRGEVFAHSDLLDIAEAVGDYPAARAHAETALALAHQLQNVDGVSVILHELAKLQRLAGAYSEADALLEKALGMVRGQGQHLREAVFAGSRAYLFMSTGRVALARSWLDASVETLRAGDFPAREWSTSLQHQALLAHLSGDAAQALQAAEAAVELVRPLFGRMNLAHALLLLGRIAVSSGQLERAETAYRQAYETFAATHPPKALVARAGLAAVALRRGDRAAAHKQTDALLAALAAAPHRQIDELLEIYLTCYQVLQAAADPRAGPILQSARTELARRAEGIADPAWRAAFLSSVAAHRAIAEAGRSPAALSGGR